MLPNSHVVTVLCPIITSAGIRSPVAIELGELVVVNHHDHAHVQCVLNRGTLDRKPLSFYAHGTATTWT